MNEEKSLALKIDLVMMFVDVKVIFILWMMAGIYRNTVLSADVHLTRKVLYADALRWLWEDIASGYVKWIPVIIVLDFVIKRILKAIKND